MGKEQKLVALQKRLEESLGALREAQLLYSQQQRVLNAQQETIHELMKRPRATPAEHKAVVKELHGHLSGPSALAQSLAMSAAPGLLDALQNLTAEKDRMQAELDEEQSSLEEQLRYLREQMAALDMEEAEDSREEKE